MERTTQGRRGGARGASASGRPGQSGTDLPAATRNDGELTVYRLDDDWAPDGSTTTIERGEETDERAARRTMAVIGVAVAAAAISFGAVAVLVTTGGAGEPAPTTTAVTTTAPPPTTAVRVRPRGGRRGPLPTSPEAGGFPGTTVPGGR